MALLTTALSAATDLVAEQAKSELIDFLKKNVIGKLSHQRARNFFDTFVDEVRKEKDVRGISADLNDMLSAIAKSEKQANVVFDAYRHVALSASRETGPMVIGLLTAEIVLESREATESEELIFEAAETLRDRDFEALNTFLSSKEGVLKKPFVLAIPGPEDQSPLESDVTKHIGAFALKLKNMGLFDESVRPRAGGKSEYLISPSTECWKLHSLWTRARQAVFKL